jgi:hypothetical protein
VTVTYSKQTENDYAECVQDVGPHLAQGRAIVRCIRLEMPHYAGCIDKSINKHIHGRFFTPADDGSNGEIFHINAAFVVDRYVPQTADGIPGITRTVECTSK